MPTYDYVCDACEHEFELFQAMKDPILKKCPKCGKLKLRRLFGTGAAIVFKGSGFYQTDYRSDAYKKKAAAEKSSEGKSSDSKSSESKSSEGKTSGESKSSESKSGDTKKGDSKSGGKRSKGDS
ncbi:MAG TPA: zinc ribbon domain-containing protein [Pirellulales bacterium]